MKKVKQIKVLGLSSSKLLGDEEYIKDFMIKLVEKIGMQPLDEPFVYNVPLQLEKLGIEPYCDSGGITSQIVGFVTLSTSHLAIHTFGLENKFYLDIFSCREFELKEVKKFICNSFNCEKMKVSNLTKACNI